MAVKGLERARQVPLIQRTGSLPDIHLKNSKLVSVFSHPSIQTYLFLTAMFFWYIWIVVWKCLTRRSIGSGVLSIRNATKPPLQHWVQFLTTRGQGRSTRELACPTNCFKRCVSEKQTKPPCKSKWVKLRVLYPFLAKISSYPLWTPNLNWESNRGSKIHSKKDRKTDNRGFPQICTA